MMSVIEERGRITARVSSSVAEKLQEAAELTGATLNQFLVQAALEKAEMIIDREHLIRYSRRDAAMMIDLLENPKGPNKALTMAFENYEQKVANGVFREGVGTST